MKNLIKIVGFGNSLTFGYLVNKGYLDFLNEKLRSNIKIINSGVPGDTIIDGYERIEYSVIKYSPDITIIEFCLNDAFSNISIEKFENYYLSVLSKIGNSKIIMIPHALYEVIDIKTVKPYYDKLFQISKKLSLPLINVSKYKFTRKELLSDMLHPNESGYRIYADEAYAVLEENFSIS